MSFSCKKCLDEGFDFGPKAVQVACSCEAGKRWLHRYATPKHIADNAWVVMPLPESKPSSDKAGINKKGEVWRYFVHNGSEWVVRDKIQAIYHPFWVRNAAGRYGIWYCKPHTAPGDLVNDDDDPCQLWAVAPFAPDRPDLDPPEVRR